MTAHVDDPGEQLLPRLRAWRRHSIHVGLSPRTSAFWSGLLYREPRGVIREYARLLTRPCSPATAGARPIPRSLPG